MLTKKWYETKHKKEHKREWKWIKLHYMAPAILRQARSRGRGGGLYAPACTKDRGKILSKTLVWGRLGGKKRNVIGQGAKSKKSGRSNGIPERGKKNGVQNA